MITNDVIAGACDLVCERAFNASIGLHWAALFSLRRALRRDTDCRVLGLVLVLLLIVTASLVVRASTWGEAPDVHYAGYYLISLRPPA